MARKSRGKGSYGYVQARYIHNRSKKTGKRVTADVKRVMFYNAYGNKQLNPEMTLRGKIYNERGQNVTYQNYKTWGLERTRDYAYTYRVIISPKGHLLGDLDFVEAVGTAFKEQQFGDEFRLLIHRDTENSHAHLLFQADKTMSRRELETWKSELREQMMSLETGRAKEKGLNVPVVDGEAPVVESAEKTRKRSRRRRRSRGKENDLSL